MSVESDFRAALAAYSALTTAVGVDGIALNALPQGHAYPAVEFVVQHSLDYGLNNTLMVNACNIAVRCWGNTAAEALSTASLVKAALAASATAQAADATVITEANGLDPEMGIDVYELTVEWWVKS